MKRTTPFTIISLATITAISMLLTACPDSTEGPNVDARLTEALPLADYPYPVGVLFANEDYTYFIEHVTEPGATDAFMVAGYNDSSVVVILEEGTARVTFVEHPEEWNGGGTLAQRPVQLDPYNVYYDLSSVSTISFEIRSNDIGVDQVSFGVQWEGPDYDVNIPSKRSGGEKLLTLEQLAITDITDWTKVTIDVSPGGEIPDTATLRHDHIEVAFHADAGKTYVKVPLMMLWAGRSHIAGESFEIRNIAFLGAVGEHVEIASAMLTKASRYAEKNQPTPRP